MGKGLGMTPGEEMKAAAEEAQALGIPYSLCDREVQTTLRRAWSQSSPWNKAKLAASLLSSTMSNEKMTAEEIEKLKDKSMLDEMMGQLARLLLREGGPDRRARRIPGDQNSRPRLSDRGRRGSCGIARVSRDGSRDLDEGRASTDLSDIDRVPPHGPIGAIVGWIIPAAMLGLIVLGFLRSGATASLGLLARWLIIHGLGAAIGAILALGSPITVLVAFAGSPVVVLKPFLSIGLIAALVEAWVKKPQVRDFENLSEDILSIRGFYRNKITKVLLVFVLASLGGAIGNLVSLPIIGSLVL